MTEDISQLPINLFIDCGIDSYYLLHTSENFKQLKVT